MSIAPQTFTQEETIQLIAERAKVLADTGQPLLFDVMLNRRDKNSGISQSIASLSQATLEQLQDPMRWVPMLCGGGEYVLNVRHQSVPGRIGGPLPFTTPVGPGMEPRAPNPLVTLRPDWQGPGKINAPALPDPVAPQHTNGAVALTSGYGMPTGTGVPSAPGAVSDRERELQQQLADMRANTARIEAEAKARGELEAVKRDADARVREAEQRGIERQRESDQRMRDLESKLNTLASTPPKTETSSSWERIVPLVMPLVQQMMQSAHETRQMMLKLSEDQNRRQLEANEKQHQAQMELTRAITAVKPGMSEEMKMLITTLQAQVNNGGNDAMSSMMTRMVEAMGMVSKTSMAMIETTVDALGGDPEHPAVIAIREGANALKTIMQGNREAAMKTVKKQLPAGQPQPSAGLTPAEIAQINAQRMAHAKRAQAQQQAAQAAGRQTPQKPAAGPQTVTTRTPPSQAATTPPVPAGAPSPESPPAALPAVPVPEAAAAAEPTLGFTAEGYPEASPGTGLSNFQVLAEGVRAMKDPQEVAGYFIKLVKADEPSVKAELDKHGGSPFVLLQAVVGQEFISTNLDYFKALGTAIDAKGAEENVWGPAEDDEGDPESEPEEEAPSLEPVA